MMTGKPKLPPPPAVEEPDVAALLARRPLPSNPDLTPQTKQAPVPAFERSSEWANLRGRGPKRGDDLERLTVGLPRYVVDDLKERAHKEGATVRYILLQALAANGVHVDPEDLVPDIRKIR